MNDKLISDLRVLLQSADLTQDQYATICRAIRALGGNV